ncbi:hypothetical protein CI109_106273 [Kwoniella shandongensis]|uniref:Uncharacterized protein n=1 Tax=Kwoniella shandongensis TaxID=1734106 RepID=A0A5M6BQA1_9TREE|nr:uncharacterized protein CI109_006717 [Kwoniella shandongensis]KAA5524917.1 hypothetical protein CI109_006717 [Kwoniella shandongensis]
MSRTTAIPYPGPKIHELPLEEGVPTQAEIEAYPPLHTWNDLKGLVKSGHLHEIGRAKQLSDRYNAWRTTIAATYGSPENYLIKVRLPFKPIDIGRPSDIDASTYLRYDPIKGFDTDLYAILPNSWPYAIPHDVRHYCIWSRIPIVPPHLVHDDPLAWAKIQHDGLGGFTGVNPAAVDEALKDEWTGVQYEAKHGHEMAKMVRALWDERGWECLWFINPPRLQSIPGLYHSHVLARRKSPEEIKASEQQFKQIPTDDQNANGVDK